MYIDGCAEKSECENQAILQHVKYTRYECTIYTVIGQGLPELTPVEIVCRRSRKPIGSRQWVVHQCNDEKQVSNIMDCVFSYTFNYYLLTLSKPFSCDSAEPPHS